MKKEPADVTITEIENAIANAGDTFTAAALVKSLNNGKTSEPLRKRIERTIAADDTIFHDEKWHCCTRKSFFNKRKFIITPDNWEIDNGILFPGHRFIPYISASIFPSAVEMKLEGLPAAMKKTIVPLGNCFHYHIMLGSEQIFDFFLADDPANESLKKRANRTDSVTLSVYDMKDFYRKNEFLFGDALLCTVEDHDKGIVSFEYLSGSLRANSQRKEFFTAMDNAAVRVWDEFQDYPDIPEQLAWMVYYASSEVTGIPGASIDEFLGGSEKVQLRPEGDHAVLTVVDANHKYDDPAEMFDQQHDDDIPEGFSISSADLNDPMKLLADAGAPLTIHELDGFILDAIYGRETDFSGVQSRIFANAAPELTDDAQNAVLLNFLEERFENFLENYNRTDDEPKAELRSQIVESVSRRMDYLAVLAAAGHDPDEKEKNTMRKLADVSAKLGEALKLINHPGFTPDHKEKESLEIMIDDQIAIQEDILSDYSTEADQ